VETDRRNDFDSRLFPARLELLENTIADITIPAPLGSLPSNVELPAFPTLIQTSHLFNLNKEQHVAFLCMPGSLSSEASWPTFSATLYEAGMMHTYPQAAAPGT
jgi:hypothetical protein